MPLPDIPDNILLSDSKPSQTSEASPVKEKPDIIVVDGGSTDSGPAYLGKGKSKYSRSSTKSEWKTLMVAREKLKIPLLIGSAGTCGTDKSVDWFFEITKELARELNQKIKITLLKCSQSQKDINLSLIHI